jgi:hypothetical protein
MGFAGSQHHTMDPSKTTHCTAGSLDTVRPGTVHASCRSTVSTKKSPSEAAHTTLPVLPQSPQVTAQPSKARKLVCKGPSRGAQHRNTKNTESSSTNKESLSLAAGASVLAEASLHLEKPPNTPKQLLSENPYCHEQTHLPTSSTYQQWHRGISAWIRESIAAC